MRTAGVAHHDGVHAAGGDGARQEAHEAARADGEAYGGRLAFERQVLCLLGAFRWCFGCFGVVSVLNQLLERFTGV